MAKRKVLGLRELVAPLSVPKFLAETLFQKSAHLRSRGRDFSGVLSEERLLSTLRSAKANPDLSIKASFRRTGGDLWFHDVSPQQVPNFYAAGATLCIMGLEALVPELWQLLLRVKSESQFAGSIIPSVYYSPEGQGFDTHFDARTTFSMQISGSKVWRYSREPAVPLPGANVIKRPQSGRFEYAVQSFGAGAAIPEPRESEFIETKLIPGDVLVLPPGTWHKANAEGRSLAINLSFNYPLGSFPFVRYLERALARSPEEASFWRMVPPAVGINGEDATPPAEVHAFFEQRFAALQTFLKRLDPKGPEMMRIWRDEVLSHGDVVKPKPAEPQTPGPVRLDTHFRGPWEGALLVQEEKKVGQWKMVWLEKPFELPIPAELAPLLRRIAASRAFSATQCRDWGRQSKLSWSDVRSLLEQLESLGVIERQLI